MSKKISPILNVIILTIILALLSYGIIVLNGRKYIAKIVYPGIESLDNLDISYELKDETDAGESIVKCVDKKIEGDTLYLTFESVSEGTVYVELSNKNNSEYSSLFKLFVHKHGIITKDYLLGDCSFGKVIPISTCIILAYVYFLIIKNYKKSMKENVFNHKNIFYLGILIFLGFVLTMQIITILNPNYGGLSRTMRMYLNMASEFSYMVFPIAFITGIMVTISNIVLIKKEGFSFRNIMGLVLSLVVCIMPFIPDMLYKYLSKVDWTEINREGGVGYYIENFAELSIYSILSYLECVLIASIALGIKAARHIPEYDKDYILILGCKIKKDGSLTNLLKGRVNRAIEFRNMQKEKTGKDLVFVASGGKGDDEIISEAEAIKNYLLEQGIEESKILLEDKSKNTNENIKNSYELIKKENKDAKIAFSTTNYHVFRSGTLATDQGIKLDGIGAKTRSYFWINAFVREFIASMYYQRKHHIRAIIIFLLFCLGMIQILYFSNL